jgi:hypothetical protein
MKRNQFNPGIGPTEELSMRVSVAVLIRVLFKNPVDGQMMIALERTATLMNDEGRFEAVVRVKPFGGGVRLVQTQKFKQLIGDYHYDSERSSEEGDLRILINPVQWDKVKAICQEHQNNRADGIINSSPVRELTEEFEDSLGMRITSEDFDLTPREMIVEEKLTATENVNAPGIPTRRIYYPFDAVLKDLGIIKMMIDNDRQCSDLDLQIMAKEDAKRGGKGRANAVLTVSHDKLVEFYLSSSKGPDQSPKSFEGHQLEGNIPVILDLPLIQTPSAPRRSN